MVLEVVCFSIKFEQCRCCRCGCCSRGLLDRKSQLSKEDAAFVDYLVECGQENVLKTLETTDGLRLISNSFLAIRQFLTEIRSFDQEYPGGVWEYIRKCRDLLNKSSKGANPFDGWTPSVHIEFPCYIGSSYNRCRVQYRRVSSVGERGFGGIDALWFHSDCRRTWRTTWLSWNQGGVAHWDVFSSDLLELVHQEDPCDSASFQGSELSTSLRHYDFGEQQRNVFLFISFHSRTVNYLKNNNYFGMPADQVYVTMQNCIPAVRNLQGEIACDPSGHIIRKPHGHGDIHLCLYRVGNPLFVHWKDKIIDQWVEKYDLNRIIFFQDTNTMSFHTMPSVIAISTRNNAHMVSTCVKRRPHEQVSLISSFHIDGRSLQTETQKRRWNGV